MRVLVIPEDFRNDQYILKPILRAMFSALGRPRTDVRICTDPLFRGVAEATDWQCIGGIVDRYRGMTDLFILCVERDGDPNRRAALNSIEVTAGALLGPAQALLAENAWQEIEVWALAGLDLPAAWSWQEIRSEVHPKERYFLPTVERRGLVERAGGGRKMLAVEAARRYDRIRKRCPEDIGALEARIRAWLQGGAP